MKISVVTVARNAARTLADTLESVAAQTHPEVEHIVVDGASTDGSLDIIEQHRGTLARVLSEPDQGIYDAMNKGIALASGEVIGFLNADDVYANAGVLANIAAAFADPGVEACYGDLVYVGEDMRRVVRYWKSGPYRAGRFARGWCPPHPTFYVRRTALARLGAFDLAYRLAADVEFMMRYLERGGVRAVYLPEVLVRMRVGGATNRSLTNIIRQNREVLDALRKNGVPFRFLSFLGCKIINRSWQRLAARQVTA